MFVIDEPTAEAIRRAFDEGADLSGILVQRALDLDENTPRWRTA